MGKTGWKRLLSAFLCVCMVAVMAPTAFAGEETTFDLTAAIQNATDGSTITVPSGTYTMPASDNAYTGKALTIKAAENADVTFDMSEAKAIHNAVITFENVTFDYKTNKDYIGLQHASKLTYNNCQIKGKVFLYATEETFNNCVFTQTAVDYNVWTYGAVTVNFDHCTFDCAGKSVLLYNEGTNTATALTVTGCTFTASAEAEGKAAIEIDTSLMTGTSTVAIDSATTAAGFANGSKSGNPLWNDKKVTNNNVVTVAGKKVWANGTFVTDAAEINGVKYTSLAEAVAAAKDGDTVKLLHDIDFGTDRLTIKKAITLDLAGHKITTNNSVCTLYFTKTATVTDSVGNGKIENTYGTANGIGIVSGGEDADLTLNGVAVSGYYGVFIQKGANVAVINSNIKASFCGIAVLGQNDSNKKNTSVIVKSGTVEGGDYAIAGNGTMQGTEITITGGTIRETGNNGGGAIYHPQNGTLSISGDALIEGENGIQLCSGEGVIANITGGVIRATGNDQRTSKTGDGFIPDGAALSIVNRDYPGGTPKMNVLGGYFAAEKNNAVLAYTWSANKASEWTNAKEYLSINGGLFTSDPSDYCADNLTGVPSGNTTYPWAVGTKSATKADIAVGAPTVNAPDVSYAAGSKEKTLLDNAQTALMTTAPAVTGTGVETAASAAANKNTVTANDEVVTKLNNQMNGTSATKVNTNIVIQTYMDITITGVDATENKQSISVEIQPMYRTVATTADVNNGDEIVLKAVGAQTVNAVQIGQPQKLDVQAGYPVEVTIPLPAGFVTANLKVKHEKNGKLVGYHDVTCNTADNTITFINDKGFSTFTVLSDARSTTIQFTDKDGSNIGSAKSYGPSNVNDALPTTAAESGYVFNGWKFEGIDGVYTTLTDELLTKLAAKGGTVSATPDFSKRSSGSSSGKTTYKVTTSAVNNGGVNASPSSAEKGAAITITLSPDKGYKLDKLTVTDGSGKTISTTRKSDTVYTFTMPASAVKVSVSYIKDDSAVVEPTTGFSDVAATAWYAKAVKYAVDKGMMNGVGGNKFAPDGVTNRGMIVTVLYRLENEPTASAVSFTDVESGAYYANAVAWASANGIVTGYGNGKFGPNDSITREQFAAILYRYAQYKKYDVSVGEDTNILSYNDAQSISAYAIPAIQWACGAGVMNGSNGRLTPKLGATRAQAAQLLMNFCENAAK